MKRYVVLLALVMALSSRAEAQAPPCSSLPGPIVYLQVGDTQTQVMKNLGRKLRDNTPKPITLVFTTSGSCLNIEAIYTNKQMMLHRGMLYMPSFQENPTWTIADAPLACDLDAARVPDVANSALFNSACTQFGAPPADVHLEQGPTQAYVLAVPMSSTETAITFEEAYFVFGFGNTGMIAPWTDQAQKFTRMPATSTLLAWAANLSLTPDKWKATPKGTSKEVVDALNLQNPNAIGLLGSEVYDANRATLKTLAYRAKGQYAAYYPDSSSSSRDKKNVRDGHYTVWSPTIWMDKVNGATPVNADARYVIDLIVNKTVTPAPNFSASQTIAEVGLVPECAMGVNRTVEGGVLSLYTPPASCVCKFESVVATSTCQTCTTTCATGVCRDGFCEAR